MVPICGVSWTGHPDKDDADEDFVSDYLYIDKEETHLGDDEPLARKLQTKLLNSV